MNLVLRVERLNRRSVEINKLIIQLIIWVHFDRSAPSVQTHIHIEFL